MFSCRIHRNFSGFQMQDEHNCFVFLYVMPGRCPRCVALRRMHHHAAKIQNILYLQALWQKNLHLKLGLVVTKGCPKFVDAWTSPRRRMDEPSSTHGRASVDALTSLRRRIDEPPSLQRVRARTRGSMAIRPNGDKKRTAPSLHGIERSGVWLQIRIYSAAVSAGASAAASVVSSATGASAAGASAAVAFLERRVRFAFFCVLAMFSSKSTSSMKQVGALSP